MYITRTRAVRAMSWSMQHFHGARVAEAGGRHEEDDDAQASRQVGLGPQTHDSHDLGQDQTYDGGQDERHRRECWHAAAEVRCNPRSYTDLWPVYPLWRCKRARKAWVPSFRRFMPIWLASRRALQRAPDPRPAVPPSGPTRSGSQPPVVGDR